MGRVWIAEQLALERKVAIKVLSDEAIQSQTALELFYREARATARVDSPHVIRVLDFDVTEGGWPFLVLELLVGETLEERVHRGGPMPLDDVRDMIEQTCDALGTAHDCGILHRDIKAENLFLQRSLGRRIDIKLLDFGIALFKTGAHGAHQTVPVGTPQYMSPEQMLAADLDERADLFSVGVCAYYALTGTFPYKGDTVAEIGYALSCGTFAPASSLRQDLPCEVDAWLRRALAIPVEERFSSAEEMADAFVRAVGGELALELSTPARSNAPAPAASVAVEALELAEAHEGWPRAVWQATGAMAALACVLVAVHAEVDRAAPRVDTTETTSARLAPAPVSQLVVPALRPPALRPPAPPVSAPPVSAAPAFAPRGSIEIMPAATITAAAADPDAGTTEVPRISRPRAVPHRYPPRRHISGATAEVIPGAEGFGPRE